MYFADHAPPHFHAIYAEHESLVRIDDGAIIGGRLPTTASRLVEQWRLLHREELASNWELAQIPAALFEQRLHLLQNERVALDRSRVVRLLEPQSAPDVAGLERMRQATETAPQFVDLEVGAKVTASRDGRPR